MSNEYRLFDFIYKKNINNLLAHLQNIKLLENLSEGMSLKEAIRLAYEAPWVDTEISRQIRAATNEAILNHNIEIKEHLFLLIKYQVKIESERKEFFIEIELHDEKNKFILKQQSIENENILIARLHQIELYLSCIDEIIKSNNKNIFICIDWINFYEKEKLFFIKQEGEKRVQIIQIINYEFEEIKKLLPSKNYKISLEQNKEELIQSNDNNSRHELVLDNYKFVDYIHNEFIKTIEEKTDNIKLNARHVAEGYAKNELEQIYHNIPENDKSKLIDNKLNLPEVKDVINEFAKEFNDIALKIGLQQKIQPHLNEVTHYKKQAKEAASKQDKLKEVVKIFNENNKNLESAKQIVSEKEECIPMQDIVHVIESLSKHPLPAVHQSELPNTANNNQKLFSPKPKRTQLSTDNILSSLLDDHVPKNK